MKAHQQRFRMKFEATGQVGLRKSGHGLLHVVHSDSDIAH